MKKSIWTALLSLILLAAITTAFAPKAGDPAKTGGTDKAAAEKEIKWMSIEEAFEATQKKPKKIFIDVYTDWCGWCKRMDQTTFADPDVAAYMNEHFYAVKFNAEQKEDVKLGGTTFKFVDQGRRGYHQLAVALMKGKMSYPTVVVLNEEFQLLHPYPGFREPTEMKGLLEFYANNKHLQEPEEGN